MSVTDVGPEQRLGRHRPDAPETIYQLSYGLPDDVGAGWTLLVRSEDRRWSIRVLLHLGAHTGDQQARAAATRALAEQGVAVADWDRGDQGDPPVFRARLADADIPTNGRAAPSEPTAFRLRGHAVRGH
jgi:hypothetical protein